MNRIKETSKHLDTIVKRKRDRVGYMDLRAQQEGGRRRGEKRLKLPDEKDIKELWKSPRKGAVRNSSGERYLPADSTTYDDDDEN